MKNRKLYISKVLLLSVLLSLCSNYASSFTVPNSTILLKLSSDSTLVLFQNVKGSQNENGALISWNLNYELYELAKEKNLVIKYNTKLNATRNKEGIEETDWMYSEVISAKTTSYKLEGLKSDEKYVFKIGLFSDSRELAENQEKGILWSSKSKFSTAEAWGLKRFFILIGSLVLFIYGMKLMSEGLQRSAGSRLRQMLRAITSSSWRGVASGFGITSIVQSSSVTTVMTVSFVNAGLLSLRQSAGVMMGANIGTTITGWLILLVGFKVNIASYSLVILAFAGPLLFIRSGKAKAWSSAIIGFCILFIGLSFLKDAAPDLSQDSALVQFFQSYKDLWYGSIMFVLLGALVTVIIQSSSAAMALTMTMVSAGLIPFEVACAMVLGENIGTTITAEIASLIANVHAKRSARIHSLFNIFGVTWMLLVFPFALKGIGFLVGTSEGTEFNSANTQMASTGIALFHTCFNLANVLLMIWFIPQLVSIAERTVKSKGDDDEQFRLEFIGGPIQTAELSLLEVRKEMMKFGRLAKKMSIISQDLLSTTDKKRQSKCYERLEKYEEITDKIEIEISTYLSKLSKNEMSVRLSEEVQHMLSASSDLESVGDIYYQIGKAVEIKNEKKHWFNQEQRDGLKEMNLLVDRAFDVMLKNLENSNKEIDIEQAKLIEDGINKLRNNLRKKHLKTIGEEGYNMKAGIVYSDIFSSLEKVGDHVISITETLAGEQDIIEIVSDRK
jgi:phosphate:Na+ symporter